MPPGLGGERKICEGIKEEAIGRDPEKETRSGGIHMDKRVSIEILASTCAVEDFRMSSILGL